MDNEITFLKKLLEQLRGYNCGQHERLVRFIEKRSKEIEKLSSSKSM